MGIQERKERERKMRQQQIMDASKQVFLEKGFKSTKIEDIAQKAELSVATIYLYFKNKDELYTSLNLATLEFLRKEIEKVCNNKKLPIERKFFQLKKAFLEAYYYDPLIFRNILHMQVEGTLPMISTDLLAEILRLTRECIKGVSSIFEQGIKEGKLINGNVRAYGDAVWGLFTGLIVWQNSRKTFNVKKKDYLESTLDLGFRVLFRGITTDRNAIGGV